MKKFKLIFLSVVIGLSIMTVGTAYGYGYGKGCPGMRICTPENIDEDPRCELRLRMRTASLDILVELSRQTRETIEKKLEYKPIWAIIDEYKVDFDVFKTKMKEKEIEIIKQVLADGKITQYQADRMMKRIDRDKRFMEPKGGF